MTRHHHLLPVPNGPVHYWTRRTEGARSWIVFTHGALMDHHLFDPQVDYFAEQGYHVLVWDAPGHGQSRPCADVRLERAVEALVAILEREECGAVHLVGQSMGGFIAQLLEQRHPERVRSLTSIERTPIAHPYSWLDRTLLRWTPFFLKLYPYNALLRTIAKSTAYTEAARLDALRSLQSYRQPEVIDIMTAVYQPLGKPEYRPVACPLLIVVGAENKVGKTGPLSKAWAARREAPLVVVPQAGHNANRDHPDFYNRAQLDFVRAHDASV